MWDTVWLFRESVLGSGIIAIGCAVVGVYVVLRRMVFVGAALAQLASAGAAFALFLASLGLTMGVITNRLFLGAVLTLAGVVFFGLRDRRSRVPSDAVLGAAFVVAGAVSVVLVSGVAAGDIHELFFGGDVLFIDRGRLAWLAVTVASAVTLHAFFFREFLFSSFDPEMAASLGHPVRAWNLLLFLTIGAVITVAMDAVGVLLTFSYLVLPGMTGLLLAGRMAHVFAVAIGSGLLGSVTGFFGSVWLDVPTAPSIIVALGLLASAAWGGRLFMKD